MGSTGRALLFAVFYLVIAAIWVNPLKPLQFFDPHGLFIVFFGTAIIAVIATPWEYIKRFFSMVRSISKNFPDNSVEIVELLVEIADRTRLNVNLARDFVTKTKDPFLADALEILAQGFDAASIETILRRRIEVQKERENADAKMFRQLGKYPPATGLIGTVMGMITLLGGLGQEGQEDKVGPAMSIAMSATLYGIIIANFVVLPIADNLIFRTQKSIAKREMIIEGILLIKAKTTPVMVREILYSHLAPGQRAKGRDQQTATAA